LNIRKLSRRDSILSSKSDDRGRKRQPRSNTANGRNSDNFGKSAVPRLNGVRKSILNSRPNSCERDENLDEKLSTGTIFFQHFIFTHHNMNIFVLVY